MGGAQFVGRVVSNRMQKTVVVAVDYVVWRPKYKKYEKRTSKHFAHDEEQACDIGDTVRIRWMQRRRKHKNYNVENILRKVSVYTPALAAASDAAAAEAAAAGHPRRVDVARATLDAAQARLEGLRAKLEQLRGENGAGSSGSQPAGTATVAAAALREQHGQAAAAAHLMRSGTTSDNRSSRNSSNSSNSNSSS
jgi:small subunit ribosomal protein S17